MWGAVGKPRPWVFYWTPHLVNFRGKATAVGFLLDSTTCKLSTRFYVGQNPNQQNETKQSKSFLPFFVHTNLNCTSHKKLRLHTVHPIPVVLSSTMSSSTMSSSEEEEQDALQKQIDEKMDRHFQEIFDIVDEWHTNLEDIDETELTLTNATVEWRKLKTSIEERTNDFRTAIMDLLDIRLKNNQFPSEETGGPTKKHGALTSDNYKYFASLSLIGVYLHHAKGLLNPMASLLHTDRFEYSSFISSAEETTIGMEGILEDVRSDLESD